MEEGNHSAELEVCGGHDNAENSYHHEKKKKKKKKQSKRRRFRTVRCEGAHPLCGAFEPARVVAYTRILVYYWRGLDPITLAYYKTTAGKW